MTIATSINPEVLLVARESRGETQESVSAAAGVSQGLVSKAESGAGSLSREVVVAIAEFLRYPVELFYEPQPRVHEQGSACLYHRKRKTLPATLLKQLNARMNIRKLNTRKLLNGLDIDASRMFHTMDPDEYGNSPIEVARALRNAWRIPDGPIRNLTALIESAGGIVIMEDFGTRKLFGMSCWTTLDRPLFFLNSAMPTDDLRWTMAHELGHLTMHAVPPNGDPEEEADGFAGEFLAPESLFRADVRRLTFDRLPNLKAYWRIPMKAVITRAQRIGAIDQASAVKLYKQYSYRRYANAEPYPLTPEPPTLTAEAINVHLQDHGYTDDELARAVRLLPDEFGRDFMGIHERVQSGNVVNLFGGSSRSSTA